MGVKRLSAVSALAIALVFAAYDGWLYSHSRAPEEHLFTLYHFVVGLLVATWVVADTKEAKRIGPSFDQGWFVLVLFPVYVPYYLVSTRRWRRGVLMFVGVLMLVALPSLAELCVLLVS